VISLFAALLSAAGACAQPAQRIVSLLPSDTEILFALQAQKVVAVSDFCDYPCNAAKLPKAGDYYNPNIEKIVALKPDMVFTGPWKNNAAQRLRNAGIKVVEIPESRSIADIYSAITAIGGETGRSRQAQELVKGLSAKIGALAAKNAALKRKPRVYVELDSPHWTAGGGSYLNDMIEKAGGANIFSDLPESYARVAWETVAARNPEIIISLSAAKTDFVSLPGAAGIAAVKNKRIVSDLDRNLLTRPSPRVYQALRALSKALHGK